MSKELAKTYDPKQIEEKLYERWCENKYFHAEVDRSKKPFTTVMPPPNITGKLHMGHALDNTLQDILIRYKDLKRIYGYKIKDYWRNIASVDDYYSTNTTVIMFKAFAVKTTILTVHFFPHSRYPFFL